MTSYEPTGRAVTRLPGLVVGPGAYERSDGHRELIKNYLYIPGALMFPIQVEITIIEPLRRSIWVEDYKPGFSTNETFDWEVFKHRLPEIDPEVLPYIEAAYRTGYRTGDFRDDD